ncbi:hypothetical protein [Yinghuangia sp. YIM S10712]|uniref:hypothetical protein n=1 Tax=Yinghuangia sp. YIM S10712 TaxID=3436930 RepID=UPI003F53CD91
MAIAVRDVVRYAVEQTAPNELPLLESLWQLDDEAIGRVVTRSRRRRDPLAFGMNDAVQLVLPVLWLVLTETARHATSAAITTGWRKLRVLLWFRRGARASNSKAAPLMLPQLSHEQIAEVRERVRAQSIAASLPPERAEALADAVAVRLVLAMGEEKAGDSGSDDAEPCEPETATGVEGDAEIPEAGGRTEADSRDAAEIGTEGEIEVGSATVPGVEVGTGPPRPSVPEPRSAPVPETGDVSDGDANSVDTEEDSGRNPPKATSGPRADSAPSSAPSPGVETRPGRVPEPSPSPESDTTSPPAREP